MNIKRVVVCAMVFVFAIFGNVYAIAYSEVSLYESSTSSGYSTVKNDVYFNQLMNLDNVKVKFTQDNSNYIFHITGNSSVKIYNGVAITSTHRDQSSVAPMLYKTANFGNDMYVEESSKYPFFAYTGSIFTRSTVRIGGNIIECYDESYRITSDGSLRDYNSGRDGNGDRYFIPSSLRNALSSRSYNFRYVGKYPSTLETNGQGISLLQNSSSYSYSYNDVIRNGNRCIDTCYFNINAKIAINKSYINNYRYVCFAQTYSMATEYNLGELTASMKGISLCTPTIDLKEYAECNHNWTIQAEDKARHYRYCENCEWKITEPHELMYEYDGIKNNVCTCSYIDKVKYEFKINDDFTDEVVETFDTDAEYTKHEFRNKTGYKFKHYNIYEKKYVSNVNLSTVSNTLQTIFVSTASELADKTGNVSLICEAEYEPNKFTIYYNNENNKQVELNESIEPQTVVYDEVAHLKKNIHHVGYIFKGWSLVEGGDNVDFAPLDEVTNYTAIDRYELKLYPVYSNLDFKIIYSAGSGHFADGSKYKEVMYTYYDDSELEKAFSGEYDAYFCWYYDDKGNKYRNMSDVKNYVEENSTENFTLNLFPTFGRNQIGSPERTDDVGPGGGTPGTDVLPTDNPENQAADIDSIILESNYLPYIIPFSQSDINNGSNEEKDKKELAGAVKATLSFIIKNDNLNRNQYSKWDLIMLFIKNNFIACVFSGIALLSLLIIYEVIVISRFRRSLRS